MEKREIKFRCWLAMGYMSGSYSIKQLIEQTEFDEGVTYLQFTGLKDKNGKEVYEGDILTPTVYKGGSGKNWTGFKCEVIFSKGMFCFKTNGVLIQSEKPLCNSLYLGEQSNNAFEIIGNIWENPELLNPLP